MDRRNESYVPLLCNYPDSEKINSVSEGAEAMFCRLLAKCDDEANYHGSPKRLLGKLYALRYENGTITAHKVLRYRNELVTTTLITCYIVKGIEYIHINNCKKSLRKDIAQKVYFPQFTQVSIVKGDNESVTDVGRTRNETVTGRNENGTPIQSNPIQSNPNQSKKKERRFSPPTLQQVKDYLSENPELNNIDPTDFWKGYNDGGWIDTQGKPVRNWKLKLRTRSNCVRQNETNGLARKQRLFPITGKICGRPGCGLPAVHKDTNGPYDNFYCAEHMPAKVKEKYTG